MKPCLVAPEPVAHVIRHADERFMNIDADRRRATGRNRRLQDEVSFARSNVQETSQRSRKRPSNRIRAFAKHPAWHDLAAAHLIVVIAGISLELAIEGCDTRIV